MKKLLCCLGLVVAGSAAAQSSFEAMTGYVGTTSGSFTPIYSLINGTVGWSFQPQADVSVTALGAWAYVVPNGRVLEIGLWDSSGVLLASNTITSASQPVNQSLYASITPVLLTAGQTYYLGAYSTSGAFQAVTVDPAAGGPNGNATTSPDILLGNAVYEQNSNFGFPNVNDGSPGSAIVAPNFEFQPVPEPSILGLLGAGVLVAWTRRRRG